MLERIWKEKNRDKVNIYIIGERIDEYERRCNEHIDGTSASMLIKQIISYKPQGRRDLGKLWKTCEYPHFKLDHALFSYDVMDRITGIKEYSVNPLVLALYLFL